MAVPSDANPSEWRIQLVALVSELIFVDVFQQQICGVLHILRAV